MRLLAFPDSSWAEKNYEISLSCRINIISSASLITCKSRRKNKTGREVNQPPFFFEPEQICSLG